ncbi:MAG: translation initiation factor IF-2 [Bdellovibrionota bacterium]
MSRTRVLDLAKELGIETKVAIIKLQELGIQVKNHFNAISDVEAAKLRALHRSGKTVEKTPQAKPVNKLIIRRKIEVTAEELLPHEHTNESPVELETSSMQIQEHDRQDTSNTNSVEEPFENTQPSSMPTQFETPVEREGEVSSSSNEIQSKDGKEISSKISIETKTTTALNQEALIQHQQPQPKIDKSPKGVVQTPPAAAPAVKSFSGGAVIVRKAEPVAPSAQNSAPQKRPGFNTPQQQQGQNSFRGNNNFSNNAQGSGNQRPQFNQNSQGGYSQNSQGGYRQNNDAPQGGGYRPTSEGGYRRGNDAGGAPGQGNTFSPRPQGAGYAGGPNTSPRGNYNQTGSAPRPNYPGSKPFVMPEAAPVAAVSKDLPSRIKYTDKDREKRRTVDENDFKNQKNPSRLKNRFDEELVPGLAEIDLTVDQEEQGVRTMIPNRKKGSPLRKKEHKKAEPANPMKASKKVLRIDEFITVNDLASELSQKSTAVIKTLMKLGMMATINQQLDFDTANFVAQEFGFETQNSSVSIGDILARKTDKSEGQTEPRPPIITIMGHVDHGKTSLLDAIRSAKVAAKEAGGITQHIGAYQIEYNGRKLTFLDTPGHEAFTAMRGRGAKVTDLVVLVVAADDGVMPQTIEAIAHAKAAQVPILVAINKMDKPGVNIERITRELSDQGVIPEEWGGESMFVQVSAKTHLGLNELIEAILLQADVLDLKASKEGLAEGVVIEAKLDKSRGAVATVIVTKGILKQQDFIVVGKCLGRVRALYDDHGHKLAQADPATPVEIVGLDGVPESGDHFNCVASDAIAKEAVAFRIEKQRQKDLAGQRGSTMEELLAQMSSSTEEKPKELSIIIKADTHGSAEAIKSSIQKLDTAKVKTRIIHSAVGGITETDAILAQASSALIVGFNVRPDKMAAQFAERAGTVIQCFSIIYQLTEAIQAAMLGTLSPVKQDKVLGHAEVRTTFSVPKVGVVAGTMILDGKVTRNSHMRVVRDGVVVYTGRVGSLKRFKDDAKEVAQGFECGISVENYNDIKIGDVLEAFIVEEIAATLQ